MMKRERRFFTPSFPRVWLTSVVTTITGAMKVLLFVFSCVSVSKAADSFSQETSNILENTKDVMETENNVPTNINSLDLAMNIWKKTNDKISKSDIMNDVAISTEVNENGLNILLTPKQAPPSAEEQLFLDEAPPGAPANPAFSPKTGSVEILEVDLVHGGHMLHWSVEQEYLAISDIWGQKYIRFSENRGGNETSAEDLIDEEDNFEDEFSAPAEALEELHDIKTMKVPIDAVFLIQPQERAEGSYPLMVPVNDANSFTGATDEVIIAFNERLHVVAWDLSQNEMQVAVWR